MNENDEIATDAFARQWEIETLDIRGRVARRIEDRPAAELLLEQVLAELQSIRHEIASLRDENADLRKELLRLRSDLGSPRNARISPFSPSETFARLS